MGGISFKEEIDFSRRENLRDHYEYVKDFQVTLYNYKKFEEKVSAIVSSLDVDVRTNADMMQELKKELDQEQSKPIYKGDFTGDPYYKLFKRHNMLVNLLIRINGYKSWMIDFLVQSNNKLADLTEHLTDSMIELKKIEAERDLVKETLTAQREMAKTQTQQTSEQSIGQLKDQIEGMKSTITGMMSELANYKKALQSPQEIRPSHYNKLEKVLGEMHSPKKEEEQIIIPKPAYAPVPSEEEKIVEEQIEVVAEEQTQPQEEEEPTQAKTKTEVVVDELTPEKQEKIYDMLLKNYDFTEEKNKDGVMLYPLESVQEIEMCLGVSKSDYDEQNKKKFFLLQITHMFNNYSYSKTALCEFLDMNPRQLEIWMTKWGIDKKSIDFLEE